MLVVNKPETFIKAMKEKPLTCVSCALFEIYTSHDVLNSFIYIMCFYVYFRFIKTIHSHAGRRKLTVSGKNLRW